MRYQFVISIILILTATQAIAWGTCGNCGFTYEKAESANRLEQAIENSDHDHLRRLLFVKELCAYNGFICETLSEEEAGRIVQYHLDFSQSWWDAIQKIALGMVAFAGLGLGLANRYKPRQ